MPDLAVGARLTDGLGLDEGAVFVLRLSDGDPFADFTFSVDPDCAPRTVDFTDASGGAGVSSWLWDFGDGSTSTLANPTHVYTAVGSYTVALSVSGANGEARKVLRDVVIVQLDPDVDFEASVTMGAPPLSVDFTSDTSASVSAWDWDFGDGGSSTAQNPTYVYQVPGTYDVSLTAACASGSSVELKSDYIVVASGNQASVTSDNGTGVNPDILVSLSDPELGTVWIGQVDGGSVGATGLTFLVGYEDPLIPGINTFFGELLIDPGSNFAALDTGVLFGGIAAHDLSVPNDVNLIGFTFSAQVLLNSVAGFGALTNRLDFLLGL